MQSGKRSGTGRAVLAGKQPRGRRDNFIEISALIDTRDSPSGAACSAAAGRGSPPQSIHGFPQPCPTAAVPSLGAGFSSPYPQKPGKPCSLPALSPPPFPEGNCGAPLQSGWQTVCPSGSGGGGRDADGQGVSDASVLQGARQERKGRAAPGHRCPELPQSVEARPSKRRKRKRKKQRKLKPLKSHGKVKALAPKAARSPSVVAGQKHLSWRGSATAGGVSAPVPEGRRCGESRGHPPSTARADRNSSAGGVRGGLDRTGSAGTRRRPPRGGIEVTERTGDGTRRDGRTGRGAACPTGQPLSRCASFHLFNFVCLPCPELPRRVPSRLLSERSRV
ncbi:uncharacterized protein [Heliangelus exortis]|uniref:uncharacterized protein n=1 Tax=Heliangelus exortis TaxID=472823 RepID=UPI003A8EBA66